jgi:branched-chain amino acid transport system substrate-binding protein
VGLATSFRRAARLLGVDIAGSATWDPEAESYTVLFERIGRTRADAVFLGGLFDQHGRRLLEDKVAALGQNDGAVKVLAPDGFLTQRAIDETGGAATGMVVSVIGQPLSTFAPAARAFAASLAATKRLNGTKPDAYAVYGAVAADVLLTAIGRSDGTRADVIANVLAYANDESLLGPISFDKGGDVAGRGAYGVTVYVVHERLELVRVIVPGQETLDAVLGR